MRELTLELTNYCPRWCSFCSSQAVHQRSAAIFLSLSTAQEIIANEPVDVIHLSGGEPLAHPDFYAILTRAQKCVGSRNVRVQTCALEWLAVNLHVIPGVHVEGYVTPEIDELCVVKRIAQGREATQPIVRFSRNWTGECPGDCGHILIRPDGTRGKSCRKEPNDGG